MPATRVLTVPVKALDRSKSRLSPLLTPPERAVLALAMLEDVLAACLSQRGWMTWVISSDQAVLEVAARRGARPVAEEGRSLLAAIRQVEAMIPGKDAALAVVLADLPFITEDAVSHALAVEAAVAAAAATSDGGTNVLVRRPPTVIAARFGRASFAKHRWAARRARVDFAPVAGAELAFDLDRPEDVARLLSSGAAAARTLAACRELGLAARLRRRA